LLVLSRHGGLEVFHFVGQLGAVVPGGSQGLLDVIEFFGGNAADKKNNSGDECEECDLVCHNVILQFARKYKKDSLLCPVSMLPAGRRKFPGDRLYSEPDGENTLKFFIS
jgi:hypothetical protein